MDRRKIGRQIADGGAAVRLTHGVLGEDARIQGVLAGEVHQMVSGIGAVLAVNDGLVADFALAEAEVVELGDHLALVDLLIQAAVGV